MIFNPSITLNLDGIVKYAISNNLSTLILFFHFLIKDNFNFSPNCLCEALIHAEKFEDYSIFEYLFENIPDEVKSNLPIYKSILFNLMITAMVCFRSITAIRYLVAKGYDLKILASNDQTLLYTLFQAYYINNQEYKLTADEVFELVQELFSDPEIARFLAGHKIKTDNGIGECLVDFVAMAAYGNSQVSDVIKLWALLLENGLPIKDYRLNGKNILHIVIHYQNASILNLFAQYLDKETLATMLNEEYEGCTLLDIANNTKQGFDCSAELASAVRTLYAKSGISALTPGRKRLVM